MELLFRLMPVRVFRHVLTMVGLPTMSPGRFLVMTPFLVTMAI